MTPRSVPDQAPPSMGFSRQEYWSGLLFPSPGDLSDPGIEPRSPTLQADSLPTEPPGKLGGITTNKSGGDKIPAKLFLILKYDAVKVLHLIS